MNKSAVFILLGTTTFLLGAQKAMANTTNVSTHISVHQNTSSNTINTTQINGESHSKVVVNGQEIKPDENGNINYESEDGHTSVHVNNNTGSTITPPAQPTLSPEVKEKIDELKKENQEKKDAIKKKIEAKREEVKKKLEDNKFDLREFIEKEFPFLKKLLASLPLG